MIEFFVHEERSIEPSRSDDNYNAEADIIAYHLFHLEVFFVVAGGGISSEE